MVVGSGQAVAARRKSSERRATSGASREPPWISTETSPRWSRSWRAASTGGKSISLGAEFEVLVDASPHVLDLHVQQARACEADALQNGPVLHAVRVPHVEGDPEQFVSADHLGEFQAAFHGVDEHVRLRFEGQRDAVLPRRVQNGLDARREPLPRVALRQSVVRGGAAAQMDGGRAEVGGDAYGPPQQVDPALGPVRHERRTVLAPGVEEVGGAGLDRHVESVPGQVPGDRVHPPGQVVRVRVEVTVVEGERDAVVAEVGEDREDVAEPVVGEAVGPVAESEG